MWRMFIAETVLYFCLPSTVACDGKSAQKLAPTAYTEDVALKQVNVSPNASITTFAKHYEKDDDEATLAPPALPFGQAHVTRGKEKGFVQCLESK